MANKKQKTRSRLRTIAIGIGVLVLVVIVIAVGLIFWFRHRDGGTGPLTDAGSTAHTITVNGQQRTFRLYRPASVSTTAPTPLVVMLHGALGTGKQAEDSYGWDAKADAAHFIVAYPDGLNRSWAVSNNCCGPPAANHVDDVAFITQMVQAISDQLSIDKNRIYVSGISNGGALAYRLACNTDVFAAIGPDSTDLLGDCPSPKPISVIHIHGLADTTFPFMGGPGKRNNTGQGKYPSDTSGPAIPDLIATWRKVDSCPDPTTSTSGAVTTYIADCPNGRSVELVTIDGAGHQWPGGAPEKPAAELLVQLDPPSTALNATDTIWDFFSKHPKM